MINLRMILVCVDYWDYLSITLPYNRHHFHETLIVTSLQDTNTRIVAEKNHCEIYTTDSFYHDGADFNKWKALEEGLDHFGREGWICIMDADVLWPQRSKLENLNRGTLYTPLRRMCQKVPDRIPPEEHWRIYPVHPNIGEWAGYSQIFHMNDPHLPNPPWYEINWKHAGGADSFFQGLWPSNKKSRPPFEVLHLGESGKNWCGRGTRYLNGSKPPNDTYRLKKSKEYQLGRRRSLEETGDPYSLEKLH